MRIAAVLLVVPLLLTGCAAHAVVTKSTPSHTTAADSYTASADEEQEYVTVLRVIPDLADSSDADLLSFGPKVCANTKLAEQLKPGQAGVEDEIAGLSNSGLTTAQNALLVVASIKVFCKQFSDDIPPEYLSN